MVNIILAFCLVMLLIRACEMEKDRKYLVEQVSKLKTSEQQFKTKILADSSKLSVQSQTILSQQEAISLGLLKLEGDIKTVQSQVRQSQKIRVDSVFVPYVIDNPIDTAGWLKEIKNGQASKELIDSLMNNSVIVPKLFIKENKWYNLSGKVQKEGVLVDSLSIVNESSVTVGWKKTGFLGLKKEPLVEIKNTNPYLEVTKMNNVVIEKKKGLFEKKIFWFGLGGLVSLFLMK